jgi:hypothetical protein
VFAIVKAANIYVVSEMKTRVLGVTYVLSAARKVANHSERNLQQFVNADSTTTGIPPRARNDKGTLC